MIEIKNEIRLINEMKLIDKVNIKEKEIYFKIENSSSINEYNITLSEDNECYICRTNKQGVDKFKLGNNYIIKTDNPDQLGTYSDINICKECLMKTLHLDNFYYIYR